MDTHLLIFQIKPPHPDTSVLLFETKDNNVCMCVCELFTCPNIFIRENPLHYAAKKLEEEGRIGGKD